MAKRLLVLTRYYYPVGGGAELATHLIVTRFLSKIYDEILVVTGYPPLSTRRGRVEYRYWPLLRGRKPETVAKLVLRAERLARLAKSYDTVYIPSNTLLFVPVLLRRKGYGGRIVVHLHDYQPISYSSALFYNTPPSPYVDYLVEKYDYGRGFSATAVMPLTFLTKLYTAGLEHSDYVIAVSERQARLLQHYLPRSASARIRVVYNPLPPMPRVEKPATEKKVILYTSGAKLTKGFHVFLKALAILARNGGGFSWKTVVLQASERQAGVLAALAKHIPLETLPRLSREKLASLYVQSRTVVLPSLHEEPLPYSFVEPVFYGTLPVASKLGGIPELVPPSLHGLLLVEPGNPVELAEKIKTVTEIDNTDYIKVVEKIAEIITAKMSDRVVEHYLMEIF